LISVDTARTLARMAAAGGQFGLRLGARSASWAPVNDDGDAIPGARCWFLLVEGEFPDYRMVLPASFKRVVKVGAAALATALKGITLAADDKNNTVRATFEEARVLLAAQSATSTAAAEVDAEMIGAPMQTGVNGGYLAEALSLLGAVEVTLSLGEHLAPILITDGPPATPTAETPRGVVVMPMRLD